MIHWCRQGLSSAALAWLCVHCAYGTGVAVYGTGTWDEKGRGNHRALVHVHAPADAVYVHLPWRRRDRHPERKAVLVFDAATGERVTNVEVLRVTRLSGDVVFQPATVPGVYELYYLPYLPPGTGPFGSGGDYVAPEQTASPDWRKRHGFGDMSAAEARMRFPEAELRELQARGDFHRMDPMEVIASPEEVEALLSGADGSGYLVFAEDRFHPVRMVEDLPLRWVERGPSERFHDRVRPGEYLAFQLAVWACREPLENITVDISDLVGSGAERIPADEVDGFSCEGVDWLGRAFARPVSVGLGLVRPLWFGVQIPHTASGVYRGTVTLKPEGSAATHVDLVITVSGQVMADAGDSVPARMSRLRWLNSTLAVDDTVIPPFTELGVSGNEVTCLNRRVLFGTTGLPQEIASSGRPILARPVRLVLTDADGELTWRECETAVVKQAPGVVVRETRADVAGVRALTRAAMEFDGCLTYEIQLQSDRTRQLADVRLEVPLREQVATYMMGMRRRGGRRPDSWTWQWDADRVDNMVWLGSTHAGLQLKLGPENTWSLRHFHDTGLPEGWHNRGRGGCRMQVEDGRVVLTAYTGERTLAAGEVLDLRFRFLVTPFKPIDADHWNWRYGNPEAGANIVHVHHGHSVNPYINYPFLATAGLKELVDRMQATRTQRVDEGRLLYPAEGHINLDRGALHVWTRVNFDPRAGEPRQASFNQSLFSLELPDEDMLCLYWNIDDRGMRAYVRDGTAAANRYPALFGTHQPEWRQGERHLISLSWGPRFAIYVDGRLAGAHPRKGTLAGDLGPCSLLFRGAGFIIEAIKITDEPVQPGQPVLPEIDDHALLFDSFADWDGGPVTRPQCGRPGTVGRFEGVVERHTSPLGPAAGFSFREVPVPPPGVNVYYTVRELSNHAAELWALRSLGDEILRTGGVDIYGAGAPDDHAPDGYSWLREHLVRGYEASWRTVLWNGDIDAAVGMQGLSRWHNYYVEGLRWLMQTTGVDGLYLDGIGYDRHIMKRVAKVMHAVDPDSRINFHAGDGWNPPWDAGRNISAANLYMEHFPYLSNLWFGELFDYNGPPDYWLVEVSGIPFGLTGEMLNYQHGGNPYRGMIYGMTGRMHPSKESMWEFWDQFGIQDAEMIGYWEPDCPVRTDRQDVLATVYRKPDCALIALARWPSASGQRHAVAVPAAAPPTIDGRIGPQEWRDAVSLRRFLAFEEEADAEHQTLGLVIWTDTDLYVAFRCDQPAGVPKRAARTRDGRVWEDDAVEVFVQPVPGEAKVFQVVGNSAGVIADNLNRDMSWNGHLDYAATVQDGCWEGELRIPFADLDLDVAAAAPTIGFNLCRDQQVPSKALSCWSPVSGSFHDVSGFGRLTLSRTAAEPAADDHALPQPVNVSLRINWEALGLQPERCEFAAPAITAFQPAARFAPGAAIPVEPGKGWLLVVAPGR